MSDIDATTDFAVDLRAAARFVTLHARLLDRHRFALLLGRRADSGEGDSDTGAVAARVLTALDAYRNPDGGYGWGLEPDLRDGTSQPVGALHAFEVLHEVAARHADPIVHDRASTLCDWLAAVSLADGGLPFALGVRDRTGCAPWWADADTTTSSLHITTAVAAAAHRLAEHVPAMREHPWLRSATRYCLANIEAMEHGHAYELRYAIDFLDAVHDSVPAASEQLRRLGALIPPSGVLPVAGGVESEALRVLDIAPWPDRPARSLFAPDVVRAELVRLASLQHDDGGWPVGWATVSAGSELEWRGALTVRAAALVVVNA
ncbi:MAG TPA: hypothetical protein VF183_03480 [Acidimicrobiales bacterium]